MRALLFLLLFSLASTYSYSQQLQSGYPVLRDGIGIIDTIKTVTNIITKTSNALRVSDIQSSQNFCGVTASFTPANDTFFSDNTFIQFTSTSTNAQSLLWQING